MSTCRCSSQRINMTTSGLFSLSQPSSLPLCQHSRQRNHRVSHFKTADLAKSWYFFFAGLTSALAISSVTFLNWLSMGPWKSFWQHLAMWPIYLYYNNTPWACFLILLVFIIPCNCFLLYVINKCICLHFLYPIWVKILFQATGLKKKKKIHFMNFYSFPKHPKHSRVYPIAAAGQASITEARKVRIIFQWPVVTAWHVIQP